MSFFRVSKSSIDKVAELYRVGGSDGIIGRFFVNTSLFASIVSDLGGTGEPGLLPDLLSHCLDRREEVRQAANSAVTELLSAVPRARLFEMDSWIRNALSHWDRWENAWSKMTSADLGQFSDECFAPLALATMHSNGRVREAALRRLAMRRDGSELPFLLLRMNDWVGPIREAVRGFVSNRIHEEYAPYFIRDMALLLRIEKCQRTKHVWISEAMKELFQKDGSTSALLEGLRDTDGFIRRACLQLAIGRSNEVANAALATALTDVDPMSRLWAAKQLIALTEDEALPSLYAKLRNDAFMPVRHEALTALVTRRATDAQEPLMEALFDRHSSIRMLARYYLRGRVDAAEIYRSGIQTLAGPRLAVAILGLAECGEKTDAKLIVAFLKSHEIRFRKAAVIAIGRIAAEEMKKELLAALVDESSGVSALASNALHAVAASLAVELGSILTSHPTFFVRKNALKLVCCLSKWECLPLLLAACRDTSDHVTTLAKVAVENWLNRYNYSWIIPTRTQLANADRESRLSRECLPPVVARELVKLIGESSKLG